VDAADLDPTQIDEMDSMLDGLEDIFNIFDDNNNHQTRRLRPSNWLDLNKPHLLIQGRVAFVNSFGFLNAD
jgi:hypothetical protein